MHPQYLKNRPLRASDLPVSIRTGKELVPSVTVVIYWALYEFVIATLEFWARRDMEWGWS